MNFAWIKDIFHIHDWEYIKGGKYDNGIYLRFRKCSICGQEEMFDDFLGRYFILKVGKHV